MVQSAPSGIVETKIAPTVSVVIPAFDEEASISLIVEGVLALKASLANAGLDGPEVIVVDDGSRDRTREIVQGRAGVRLITHDRNRGYGAALKTGLAEARGELIAFLDADGTYAPEDLPRLCAAVLAGADLAIGSRMSRLRNDMPVARRLGNRAFAGLITALTRRRVRDCASGMRVLRREVLARLYPLPNGLNFTPVMSLRAVNEGLRLVEVPIAYAERIGDSKLSLVHDGLTYARSIVWTALSYSPARVLGVLGWAGIVIAVLIGLGLVAARSQGITTLGPHGVAAVFTALVAGVAGVSVLSLGVTFDYLVALFRKEPVRMRPFSATFEQHFGWMGVITGGAGAVMTAATLVLGLRGWDVARLWLYLVGSALLILVGVQFIVSWAVVRTLEELAAREALTQYDLLGGRSHDGPMSVADRR